MLPACSQSSASLIHNSLLISTMLALRELKAVVKNHFSVSMHMYIITVRENSSLKFDYDQTN